MYSSAPRVCTEFTALLWRRDAPINVEGLTDHVTRFRRGQKHERRRNFGGLAGASQWSVLSKLRQFLLWLAI